MAPWQGQRLDGTPFEDPGLSGTNFRVPASAADSRNRREREPGRDFDRTWYEDREIRGAFGRESSMQTFLHRHLLFDNDDTEDDLWGPIRPLGQGSFGNVALWQKRDDQNRIVDEVVCKETEFDLLTSSNPRDRGEVDSESNTRLTREAAIHRDINRKPLGASPHLRRYKVISDDTPHTPERYGRCRYYLEFGRYGTLAHLIRLYQCWDTYLPEVFVWHVFQNLAKACEALRGCPPKDTKALDCRDSRGEDFSDIREDLFCLHLDVKPANILLGYPHQGQDYPSALLHDYGISVYTSHSGRGPVQNPRKMWFKRTSGYEPPEQDHYGAGWEIPPDGGWIRTVDYTVPPFNAALNEEELEEMITEHVQERRMLENREDSQDVLFDHSMNTYHVGLLMYMVMTLTLDPDKFQDAWAQNFEDYQANGYHRFKLEQMDNRGRYSSHLRRLIHRCLDPNPANRPTQLDLMDRTRRGLRIATKRAKRTNASSPPKVYYVDHEINDMPLGDAGIKASLKDHNEMVIGAFVDPDIPRLKLPPKKYAHLATSMRDPLWKAVYDDANPHERWFRPVEVSASEEEDEN